jgi:hypothetical protein
MNGFTCLPVYKMSYWYRGAGQAKRRRFRVCLDFLVLLYQDKRTIKAAQQEFVIKSHQETLFHSQNPTIYPSPEPILPISKKICIPCNLSKSLNVKHLNK